MNWKAMDIRKFGYDVVYVRSPARPRKEQFFFTYNQIQVFSYNYFVANCYSLITQALAFGKFI